MLSVSTAYRLNGKCPAHQGELPISGAAKPRLPDLRASGSLLCRLPDAFGVGGFAAHNTVKQHRLPFITTPKLSNPHHKQKSRRKMNRPKLYKQNKKAQKGKK